MASLSSLALRFLGVGLAWVSALSFLSLFLRGGNPRTFSGDPIYAHRRYWERPLHPQVFFGPISSRLSPLSLLFFSWLCWSWRQADCIQPGTISAYTDGVLPMAWSLRTLSRSSWDSRGLGRHEIGQTSSLRRSFCSLPFFTA